MLCCRNAQSHAAPHILELVKSPMVHEAGDSVQHVLSWGLYWTRIPRGKLSAIYDLWLEVVRGLSGA